MNEIELAGIVAARICHDLVSPIGAVVNGTDLVRELGPANAADELVMVKQSARRAAAVLKFHRLAFGGTADFDSGISRAEMQRRADEVVASRRVRISWTAPEGPAIPSSVAQLTCLMLLAARVMLGMSGTLRVVLPAADTLPVAVIAEGDNASASPDQRRWLVGGAGPAPESRQVEFALIGPAAAAAGARVELTRGDRQLALRALPR